MLTRQGWIVGLGSIALIAAGRLFGIFELFLVGAAGIALVVIAAVMVGLTRLRLDVARELHPPRVHAGAPSRVELRVRNRATRRTPLLSLRDPVGGGRSARVVLAPLSRDEGVRAAYRLPTERRGILRVGPLAVEVTDPFGLASVSSPGAPVAELTVWPAIDEVLPLPHTHGDDPHAGADHPNALVATGEDFYALREYVVGDDLRRVHWRSTARRDELMVRQDEMPWQGRATLLLDTRYAAYTDESFERAVSATASVVVACARRRFLLRLVTTAGHDTGFAAGAAHVEAIMEHLAMVERVEAGRLGAVLTNLRRPGGGGALAAFLGAGVSSDIVGVARLRRTFARVVVTSFTAGGVRGAPLPGAVVVDDRTPFAPAWNAAIRTGRSVGVPVGVGR